MAPPSDLPRILRPKRKTRALQLNLTQSQQQQQQEEKKSQPSCALNETYDLDTKKSSDTENENGQLPTSPSTPDEITDTSVVRHLWPKYRVSFFPSPSLTPDL
ncbi:unnamed protein product [Trichobilharzia szidati]|nr:unnamed protein product [Trichobilharzia szidati]